MMNKTEIENSFFVVIMRNDGPTVKWASAIGKRQAIDNVFDWLVKTFGQDDCKWISILSHNHDAIVLDIHFFDLELYEIFRKNFEERYLPKDDEVERE